MHVAWSLYGWLIEKSEDVAWKPADLTVGGSRVVVPRGGCLPGPVVCITISF